MHGSIFSVTQSAIGALYSDKSTAVTRELGNGHSENDLRPEFRRIGEPMRWFGTTEARVPGVRRPRCARRTARDAEQILVEGAPHVMIFPNLFIAEIQVFTIQPRGGERVRPALTAVQLAGAPELNRRMVSAVRRLGGAGRACCWPTTPRCTSATSAAWPSCAPEWVDLRRGMHRERTDERGLTVGGATDETGDARLLGALPIADGGGDDQHDDGNTA